MARTNVDGVRCCSVLGFSVGRRDAAACQNAWTAVRGVGIIILYLLLRDAYLGCGRRRRRRRRRRLSGDQPGVRMHASTRGRL